MSGFFKRLDAAKEAFNASQQHRKNAETAANAFSNLITLTREGLHAPKGLARAQAVAEIKQIEDTILSMSVIGADYQQTKREYLGDADFTGDNPREVDLLSWMSLKYRGVADDAVPVAKGALNALLGK